MTDSPLRPTTSSGSKGNVGRYPSGSPPPAEHVSFNPAQVGARYGWVEVLTGERRYTHGWSACYVLVHCRGCGREGWAALTNLTSGRSRGCQACSQPRRVPQWLDRRLTAARQRCTNPNDPHWPRYGGRGIEFRFDSPLSAGLWIIEHLGLPGRQMELDRVDNDGHYEPGNLRWATRQVNAANRAEVHLPEWRPEEWPYARSVVIRKLAAGSTREQIFEDARRAVQERRKNWQGIEERLRSMTS